MSQKKVTFIVSGVDCANCFETVARSLSKLSNIDIVQANYTVEQIYTEYDTYYIKNDDIKKKIEALGYDAKEKELYDAEQEAIKDRSHWLLKIEVIINVFITSLLIVGPFTFFIPKWMSHRYFQWILATITQFWIGRTFFKRIRQSTEYRFSIVELFALIISTLTYCYSFYVLFFQDTYIKPLLPLHTYFEASTSILTLTLAGIYLEACTKRSISYEINLITKRTHDFITLLRPRTFTTKVRRWIDIPFAQLKKNDFILVKPGQSVPADGVIVEKGSTIDEQILTGKHKPIFKSLRGLVMAGTKNLSESFAMKAIQVAQARTLAQIVNSARTLSRPATLLNRLIQTLMLQVFPFFIALIFLTMLIWIIFILPHPKLIHALFILIPCLAALFPFSLGIATPLPTSISTKKASVEGIFIKNSAALEKADLITHVVFDKTGTITRGILDVKNFVMIENLNISNIEFPHMIQTKEAKKMYVLSLTRSAMMFSKHPVSQAVVRFLNSKFKNFTNYRTKNVETISGLGIRIDVNNQEVLIGSQRLIKQYNITIPRKIRTHYRQWKSITKSISFVAINKKCIALFSLSDTIRPGVKETLDTLHSMGIHTLLVTGDNEQSAQEVAKAIGVEKVFHNLLPDKKKEYIESLQKENAIVAMVGDGINDTPALVTAHIGIAMGTGSVETLELADVILAYNNLSLLPKFIKLTKTTKSIIYQNILFSFFFNGILLTVSTGIFYPFFGLSINPLLVRITVIISSLFIIGNALRIKIIKL